MVAEDDCIIKIFTRINRGERNEKTNLRSFVAFAFSTTLLSCGEKPITLTADSMVLRVCADSVDQGYLEPAFAEFTKQTGVKIVYEWLPVDPIVGDEKTEPANKETREACFQRLHTEIAAGNGPDVFVLSLFTGVEPLFPDMMKTMRSGTFLDLDPLLDKKEGNLAALNENLLPAGQVKDAHYLLPLSYQVDGVLLCDTPEKNKTLAAQLEGATLLQYLTLLDAGKPVNAPVGIWWQNLINSKNPPMNYDTKQVNLRTSPMPELLNRSVARRMAHAAQTLQATTTSEEFLNSMACNTTGGNTFIVGAANMLDAIATRLMSGTGTLFVPTPNVDGEIYATLSSVAAIGAKSKKVPQAQELLDYLLSEKFQAIDTKQPTTQVAFPARKGLLSARFQMQPIISTLDDIPYTLLSEETLASFTSLEDKIDSAFLLQKPTAEMIDFYVEYMDKSGGQLQDAAIKAIETKLKSYLSE